MELGKIKTLTIPMDPIAVKECLEKDPLYDTSWEPEKSVPGWCSAPGSGIVIGIDVEDHTMFQYPPKILPKMRLKSICFFTEYVNPTVMPSKFTLGFTNRQGKIVEKTAKASNHKLGRVCFQLSLLEIDPSRLFRAYLTVDPENENNAKLFISGSWLEINTEA